MAMEWDVAAHTCNLKTWEARQEDLKFKATLGHTARPCLKKKKKDSRR
jgi:hypothetical protein